MELFRLVGNIVIDDKQAIKALAGSEKKARDAAKALEGIGDGAAKFGKAVGLAALAAGTAIGGLAVKFADTASSIADSSKRVGMSAEEYQKWKYAAKQSGIEAQTLEGLMKKQQTSFANATDGVKTQSDAYKKLEIDISKMTSEEGFGAVINALAGMTDETARNSIANDIFGKSYADLIPLLNEGSDGIANLRQEAVDAGSVMSNESVAAGDKFGDTIDRLKATFDGIIMRVAEKLLPLFEKFTTWFDENQTTIDAFVTNTLTILGNTISWIADNITWIIPVIGGLVAAFATLQIISTINGLLVAFGVAQTIALGPAMLIVGAVAALVAVGALLILNWKKVVKFMGDAFKGIGNIVINVVNAIIDYWNFLISTMLSPLNGLIEGFNNTIGKLTGKIPVIKIEIPKIPKLADGGIAYGNSLVNVGEYPNAKSNPEVIAPLDKLQGMVGIDYDKLAKAMSRISVVLDEDKVGKFVDNRILKAV